jgi:hypothetical protein
VRRFEEGLATAIAGRDLAEARRLHRQGLARGLIPLAQEEARLAQLVELALSLPHVDVELLRGLDREFGLAAAVVPPLAWPLVERFRRRLEAETWRAELFAVSRRNLVWQRNPFPTRAARLVLGRWAPWRLAAGDARPVRQTLEGYRRHGPELPGWFDAERVEALEKRLHWIEHPGAIRRWVAWIFLGLLMAFAIWAIVAGHDQ